MLDDAKKNKKKEQKPKYEDYGEEQDMVDELPPTKTTVWNDQKDPLKDDEELDYDSLAY